MTTNELRDYIKENCGNPSIGIAPMEDFSPEEMQSLEKVNRIMSSHTPLISADTPILHPREFMDNAESIIVLGFNAFFGRDYELPGNPPRGEIMNFFVNQDCVNYIAGHTEKILNFLSDHGYTGSSIATGIPIKIMAARSGLGRYGKNAVIHAPSGGSWLALNAIFTDAPLETDNPLDDDCGECNLCQKACPTGALSEPYKCNIERCLTLHALYNKGTIPQDIREKAGTCIAQCNACLDACPKNKKLSIQNEISNPEDLVYPEIAPLVNMTDNYFQKMFGASFLEFIIMDKKYLQRNAAIALGNYGDPAYIAVLIEALETQSEEIVRSAAAWALGRIGTDDAKTALVRFLKKDPSAAVCLEMRLALDTMQ
jgi:epoxyqueuosine reductase